MPETARRRAVFLFVESEAVLGLGSLSRLLRMTPNAAHSMNI